MLLLTLSCKRRLPLLRCLISHFGSSLGWHCLSCKGMGDRPFIRRMGLHEEICACQTGLFSNRALLESPCSSPGPFCKGPSRDIASFLGATGFVDCSVARSRCGHRGLVASSPKASTRQPLSLHVDYTEMGIAGWLRGTLALSQPYAPSDKN